MNDFDYLNEISAKTPVEKPAAPLFDKKLKILLFTLIGVVVVVVATLLLVVALTPAETNPVSELSELNLRSTSLQKTLSTYNSKVKSSKIRSAGTTLSTSLLALETSTQSTIKDSYGIESSSLSLSASSQSLLDSTTKNLESARLNGLLDRYFAKEMAYQIAHLLLLEETALSKTSDPAVKEYLESSHDSLSHSYETFSSFVE